MRMRRSIRWTLWYVADRLAAEWGLSTRTSGHAHDVLLPAARAKAVSDNDCGNSTGNRARCTALSGWCAGRAGRTTRLAARPPDALEPRQSGSSDERGRDVLRCVTTERTSEWSTWWDDGGLPPVAGSPVVPGVFAVVRGWSHSVGSGRPPRCSHDPLLGLLAGRSACRWAKRRSGFLGRTVAGRRAHRTPRWSS